MTSRRQFMMTVVPAALVLPAVSTSVCAADNRVDEKDGAAVALGYKHDATKVDAKKYTTYKAGSNCANCQFYQAKATDPWGGCPLLGGKQVNAKGWCSGWAKKA